MPPPVPLPPVSETHDELWDDERCHVETWVCITESPLWGVSFLFVMRSRTIQLGVMAQICILHYALSYAFCICNRVGLAKVCILYSVFCILYFRSHPWPLGFGKGMYSVFCVLCSVSCILDPTSHPWPLDFGKGLHSVFCILYSVFCILYSAF